MNSVAMRFKPRKKLSVPPKPAPGASSRHRQLATSNRDNAMPTMNATVSRVITKEELCLLEKIPSSCGIVIFGASGDLTHRKLLPSLFTLSLENLLPKQFYILGVARSAMTDD